MNASTATARAIVTQLIECGVRDVVLAPGSRNAPLSLALSAAEQRGDLTLHVRMDERVAGFLALGLARRSGLPVPVVVTSGTAAAELLPAMVEASESGVPIMAVTADRPAEMRGTGANQTINQVGLYGSSSRFTFDLPAAESAGSRIVGLASSLIDRAVAASCDPFDPGPSHLNICFRDPLVPDEDDADELGRSTSAVAARIIDDRLTATMALPIDEALGSLGPLPTRGAVVVGDPIEDESRDAAAALAEACGWPLIAEPSGLPAVDSDALIAHASVVLADAEFAQRHRADLVLTVGRVGLSRSIMRFVAAADHHVVVDPRPASRWADPLRSAERVLAAVPEPPEEFAHDPSWLASWLAAAEVAEDVISAALDREDELSGPAVARLLMAQADPTGVVLVGASWPVRHVEAYALPRDEMPRVMGNRGASGIDGLLSTAWGVASAHQRSDEAHGPGYALIGDVAFLYDVTGLIAPSSEPRPDLVVVVIDNDGGGIFSSLEQGDARFASHFERVFGTPHGRDLIAIARAMGVEATVVTTARELLGAVDEAVTAGGVRVIVARTGDRSAEAAVVRDIQSALGAALASGG